VSSGKRGPGFPFVETALSPPPSSHTHTPRHALSVCWVSNASSSIGKQMHPLSCSASTASVVGTNRLHTLRKAHTPLTGCGFWNQAPRVTHTSCTLPSEVMLHPQPIYTLSCFNYNLRPGQASRGGAQVGRTVNRHDFPKEHESADRQNLFFGCSCRHNSNTTP